MLTLRREPSFPLYLWALWSKVPALIWLLVIALECLVAWSASSF